jgi:aryl-alcohol dehydrogenase-like predicted oxidoreductase
MSLSGVIREALDQGITLIDTSDLYGFGHNEELVGKAIKGRRSEVVLATKFGNLGGRGGKIADGRPEYVVSACEASLKRLGVDVIDLYGYANTPDKERVMTKPDFKSPARGRSCRDCHIESGR